MGSLDEVEKLWLEFYELPFPVGLAGEEINGICVTTLDTFTAGCIDTFVSKKGKLDTKRISILVQCQKELRTIVENIDGENGKYFEKLLGLTSLILREVKPV